MSFQGYEDGDLPPPSSIPTPIRTRGESLRDDVSEIRHSLDELRQCVGASLMFLCAMALALALAAACCAWLLSDVARQLRPIHPRIAEPDVRVRKTIHHVPDAPVVPAKPPE